MNAPAEALALARHGFAVFPCHPERKQPACKHGLKDASRDPGCINSLWQGVRPDALIGIATGAASGVDVLDVDSVKLPVAGDWWKEAAAWIPPTRIYRTRSGGLHVYFQHADGVRNSESKLAQGIDVRGDGGYAIAWFAHGFECLRHSPLAAWPAWLLELALRKPEPIARQASSEPAAPISLVRLAGYIESQIDRVRSAKDGAKHDTLRNAALVIGGVAAEAGISDENALERLLKALPDGVRCWATAEKTALWGLARGRDAKIKLEERPLDSAARRAA